MRWREKNQAVGEKYACDADEAETRNGNGAGALVQGCPRARERPGRNQAWERYVQCPGNVLKPSRGGGWGMGQVLGPLRQGHSPSRVILLAPEPGLCLEGAEQALEHPWGLPGGGEREAFMGRRSPLARGLKGPLSPPAPGPSRSLLPPPFSQSPPPSCYCCGDK